MPYDARFEIRKRGEQVWVIAAGFDGTLRVEGRATVVGPATTGCCGYFRVRFEDGDVCDRFIDREAQADPEGYVRRVNAQIAQG